MNTSTLYAVYKTKVTPINEYRNGYGTAPSLWDYLCQKYLFEKFNMFDRALCDRVWALWKSDKPHDSEKFTLMLTFDCGIIAPENLPLLIEGCEMADREIKSRFPTHANHWGAIAIDLKEQVDKKDSRLIGFGLGYTSVSDPWHEYPEHRKAEIMTLLEKA